VINDLRMRSKTVYNNTCDLYTSIEYVAHMARARLRDRHQENLRKKLEVLIAEQGVARTENEAEGSQAQESELLIQDEPSSSAAVEKNENSHSE